MWTIIQFEHSVTDASAKMGSNVIGDHKIHLNMAMKTIEGTMVGSLLF